MSTDSSTGRPERDDANVPATPDDTRAEGATGDVPSTEAAPEVRDGTKTSEQADAPPSPVQD